MLLSLCLIGFGLVFGAFAWMNDGARAGLGVMLVPSGFGIAAAVIAACFFYVARAHAGGSRWRWWLQVLLPVFTLYLAFGLAAEFSEIVDDLLRR